MNVSHQVSTQFLTSANAHQVGVLVNLSAEPVLVRPPINVALVLDRSGSMSGAPLDAALQAASRFIDFLSPTDRLAIVSFDSHVTRVFGPGPLGPDGKATALNALSQIHSGGSTNLSGGWLEGMTLVSSGIVTGTNRVILLTDGQANAGILEPVQLTGLTEGAAGRQVSTTCIGFGPAFNEDLLQSMARGGRGNFWYVEETDQMAAIFSQEIEGLVSLAAQNVAIEVSASHPSVAGVSFLQPFPVSRTPDGAWRIALHDLYASVPQSLGVLIHAEHVEAMGQAQVAEVKVEAQLIGEDGVEHRVITMPIFANLDGISHPDPIVESTFLRFHVARAREEALRHADQGDLDSAARTLREVVQKFCGIPNDSDLDETRRDLEAEADSLESRRFTASDRKYHVAQAEAEYMQKSEYGKTIRRRR